MCMRCYWRYEFNDLYYRPSSKCTLIICMRFLQGLFSGYINNATALMAGETPHQRSTRVMSQMMTAGTAGNLVGPLIGGAFNAHSVIALFF